MFFKTEEIHLYSVHQFYSSSKLAPATLPLANSLDLFGANEICTKETRKISLKTGRYLLSLIIFK